MKKETKRDARPPDSRPAIVTVRLVGIWRDASRRIRRVALPFLLGLLLTLLASGCASSRSAIHAPPRPFSFETDTFAYPNELLWVYGYDADGKWKTHPRETKPSYAQHCFVVACATRQFFENARFDPELPPADTEEYRRLIRSVVSCDPRHPLSEDKQIVIPGYANLREFSEGQEQLLKTECGGAWRSYFQRAHWRMIFPFSRRHQESEANQIVKHLKERGQVAAHLVRFPKLNINHAVIIFAAEQTESGIEFSMYDPNTPECPGTLKFDRTSRTFTLPVTSYFPGGRVDVYEVWSAWYY